jgi:heptosyltransferase II
VPARILIHKRGASGDVLRTTVLLRLFSGAIIDWLVDEKNAPLLMGAPVRTVTSADQLKDGLPYDLVVSLEENLHDIEQVSITSRCREIVGTYVDRKRRVRYTSNARAWFDMSLVSTFGRETANKLKLENRLSFQEHLFRMFGRRFAGQPYYPFGPPRDMSSSCETRRRHRVLLATRAGPRWPNKEWAHFTECGRALSSKWSVSVLSEQPSLRELGEEIARHDFLVSLDSLPMHIALSQDRPVCALFTCTSPWEIYEYPLLLRVVSPRLNDFFYLTTSNYVARAAISVEEVVAAVESLVSLGDDGAQADVYPKSVPAGVSRQVATAF